MKGVKPSSRTLTPPCFTLRAADYGGSFFLSPARFSILSSALRSGVRLPLKLGLGLHPRQRRDRSLFRVAIFPTRRAMMSRSDSSAAFSTSYLLGGQVKLDFFIAS